MNSALAWPNAEKPLSIDPGPDNPIRTSYVSIIAVMPLRQQYKVYRTSVQYTLCRTVFSDFF
ncbi:hypothetical protein J6590_005536, partial [Homalodisca vitripennis]